MIETILRRFLDNPSRHWLIVIAILGIGLTTVLPAADELSRSRHDRARLEKLAARMRHDVADLEDVRREAQEKQESLKESEALTVGLEEVPLLRQEIVDWARNAGCQVRRIRMDSPRSRGWQEGDSLLELTGAKRNQVDSPYVLQIQPLSVSLSGTLSQIKHVLNQLHSTERLIQCESLSVSPASDSRKEVVLNIELMLFDLTEVEAPEA